MITKARIIRALALLPEGPAAVAAYLEALDVKATCKDPNKCALAEYLSLAIGIQEGWALSVGVGSVRAGEVKGNCLCSPVCRMVRFIPSTHIEVFFEEIDRKDLEEFVLMFDQGEFPDLVASAVLEEVAAP